MSTENIHVGMEVVGGGGKRYPSFTSLLALIRDDHMADEIVQTPGHERCNIGNGCSVCDNRFGGIAEYRTRLVALAEELIRLVEGGNPDPHL